MISKIVIPIILILSFPILCFEYFVLLWYWGGDGLFTLISVPVLYAAYLLLALLVFFKLKMPERTAIPITVFSVIAAFLLPILAVSTMNLIAFLFGIEIVIQ